MHRMHTVPMGVAQAESVDVGAVLNGTAGLPANRSVAFPRSAMNSEVAYYRDYAHDCKPIMHVWIAEHIQGFVNLFDLTPITETEAAITMEIVAVREISRELTDNERRLLREVVRDQMIVSMAPQREMAREIL